MKQRHLMKIILLQIPILPTAALNGLYTFAEYTKLPLTESLDHLGLENRIQE